MDNPKCTLSPAVMIIYPTDLAKVPGWEKLSERTQYHYANLILDFAGKKRPRPLTVGDVAQWLNCDGNSLIPVFFPHLCDNCQDTATTATPNK